MSNEAPHATSPTTPLDASNPPTKQEEDFPQPEPGPRAPKFVKMTISANAANKLNLGDYSSAERGVFMSKEIQVDESLSAQEQIDFIRNETKKLQTICEAQLAGIVAAFFTKEGLNQSHWVDVHNRMFTKALAMVKSAFGIAEAPKAA
jgi:hypothetical protein